MFGRSKQFGQDCHTLLILGCRGVPAAHGGFETFAEDLSLHLASKGWNVSVYCEGKWNGSSQTFEENWRGVNRIVVPVWNRGPLGTIEFDCRCMLHAVRGPGILLILGYNTGFLALLPKLLGRCTIINMDGIEWKRTKWPWIVRQWFRLNESLASLAGDTLVADHPAIASHLARHVRRDKIIVLPYGAEPVLQSSTMHVTELSLAPYRYFLIVCRIEPENSVLELITAFSAKPRSSKLVVLGLLDQTSRYHLDIVQQASENVVFLGPIYDRERVRALRFYARAYCHGHTVGGTNPSLVEALAAGGAVIAHDNPFNRWTAGPEQFYFKNVDGCTALFDALDEGDDDLITARRAARARHRNQFLLSDVLAYYEELFEGAERLSAVTELEHRRRC